MIWYNVIQYNTIPYISLHHTTLHYNMIWYDTIRYDIIWYDVIWYDMIWYDMKWYDMITHDLTCRLSYSAMHMIPYDPSLWYHILYTYPCFDSLLNYHSRHIMHCLAWGTSPTCNWSASQSVWWCPFRRWSRSMCHNWPHNSHQL